MSQPKIIQERAAGKASRDKAVLSKCATNRSVLREPLTATGELLSPLVALMISTVTQFSTVQLGPN
jgi:hypothetical protein